MMQPQTPCVEPVDSTRSLKLGDDHRQHTELHQVGFAECTLDSSTVESPWSHSFRPLIGMKLQFWASNNHCRSQQVVHWEMCSEGRSIAVAFLHSLVLDQCLQWDSKWNPLHFHRLNRRSWCRHWNTYRVHTATESLWGDHIQKFNGNPIRNTMNKDSDKKWYSTFS